MSTSSTGSSSFLFIVHDISFVGVSQLNQLGGTYINGRPLSNEVRHEIIALALQGFRPCDISRRLQITHGCISKLLSKYRKTGSIQPGGKGVGRPRVITPHLAEKIEQYTNQQPGIYSWEIRDRLVQENVCSIGNVPSLSSISRLLTYNRTASAAEGLQQSSGCRSHSIASILNLASTSESSTLSSSSSSVSSFSSLANNEGEIQDQQMRGLCRNVLCSLSFWSYHKTSSPHIKSCLSARFNSLLELPLNSRLWVSSIVDNDLVKRYTDRFIRKLLFRPHKDASHCGQGVHCELKLKIKVIYRVQFIKSHTSGLW